MTRAYYYTAAQIAKTEAIVCDQARALNDPDRYMRRAARAVASAVHRYHEAHPDRNTTKETGRPTSTANTDEELGADTQVDICALIGGGNNGGDALYACAYLAEQGYRVTAIEFTGHSHQRARKHAESVGVTLIPANMNEWQFPQKEISDNTTKETDDFRKEHTHISHCTVRKVFPDHIQVALRASIWIDGILGAGLRGPIRKPLAYAISAMRIYATQHRPHIVAVDTPSGLYSGYQIEHDPILPANHTIAMIGARQEIIEPPTCYYAGSLEIANLGIKEPEEKCGEIIGPFHAYHALRIPRYDDHKYTRGVVSLIAGSNSYPGAGILAVSGAIAMGAGMVRLDSTERVQNLTLQRFPGIVVTPGKTHALVVGPGIEDLKAETAEKIPQATLNGISIVIDAGALDYVPTLNEHVQKKTQEKLWVLTPHAGEAARLLRAYGYQWTSTDVTHSPVKAAQYLSECTQAAVVMKGAATVIVIPGNRPAIVPQGTGWMACAGSGDVLAGMIGAALAAASSHQDMPHSLPVPLQHTPAVPGKNRWTQEHAHAVYGAVWLHMQSGRRISERLGKYGGPIRPEQIAEYVPELLGEILGMTIP
ncbi:MULTISPECIES: bifunctional ADP-dependent NAD(P)H-hydrate dehydratase/NAD(P)H-hydrate epimerase [unclassified Schaalia]|uniref:bifunctional ADP-dependent NAD(P)H-hydrate dehydratase/NAD(P)H-hydrate epimerase n=1 Tax=unclassified Schaalia TaxID=2691889 RepID=UPI001E2A8F70|nr:MULTISPECIES: bifunctional ADP-dependent NAD(P)H-hydrate dehydratase/NAD(P)H-hydrate epimerase [unclassified Schaalia]MCD4549820.1 hypothetical protein [Schaalia sp. lx-260]MCD4556836.1 hypothetical protein [Schaalia sp. lx-100]